MTRVGKEIYGRPFFIEVDGSRLEAVWHGPDPEVAPTLVFLHEGLGCVKIWRDFPAKLAEATGCGALVYSRAGYGKSDPCTLPRPVTFMHQEAIEVLPKVIGAAGIRRAILVGHSDGGSIALIYAGSKPSVALLGVITEAAHVFCEEQSLTSILAAKKAYEKSDLRAKLQKYHGANTDSAFRGWNDAWLDPKFEDWNIEEYLPGIRVPTLIIQGEQDEYGTTAQMQAIARQITAPTETLLLPNCGHSPHRDQETTVLEAMSGFIKRLITESGPMPLERTLRGNDRP